MVHAHFDSRRGKIARKQAREANFVAPAAVFHYTGRMLHRKEIAEGATQQQACVSEIR